MNYLTKIDLALGQALENVFTLGKRFQPADLARQLKRAVLKYERKTLSSRYAANRYILYLAPADYQRLEPLLPEIVADLTRALKEFLAAQGLMTMGATELGLREDQTVKNGRVRIAAEFLAE